MSISSKMLKGIDRITFSTGGVELIKEFGSGDITIINDGIFGGITLETNTNGGGGITLNNNSPGLIQINQTTDFDLILEQSGNADLRLIKSSGIGDIEIGMFSTSSGVLDIYNVNGHIQLFSQLDDGSGYYTYMEFLQDEIYLEANGANSLNSLILQEDRLYSTRPVVVGTLPSSSTPENGMISLDSGNIQFRSSGSWISLGDSVLNQQNYINLYKTNTQTANSLTWVNLVWNGTNFQGTNYTYNGTNGTITLLSSGLYKLEYTVSLDTTVNNRTQGGVRLIRNGTLIPGTLSYSYNRNTNQGKSTTSASVIINALSNDDIICQFREESGTDVVTVPNACSIIITKISN